MHGSPVRYDSFQSITDQAMVELTITLAQRKFSPLCCAEREFARKMFDQS
jgi:hypothetical protein